MKDDIKLIAFSLLGLGAVALWYSGWRNTGEWPLRKDLIASPSGSNIAPEGLTGSALMRWNMERLGYEWTKEGRTAYRKRPKEEGGW